MQKKSYFCKSVFTILPIGRFRILTSQFDDLGLRWINFKLENSIGFFPETVKLETCRSTKTSWKSNNVKIQSQKNFKGTFTNNLNYIHPFCSDHLLGNENSKCPFLLPIEKAINTTYDKFRLEMLASTRGIYSTEYCSFGFPYQAQISILFQLPSFFIYETKR